MDKGNFGHKKQKQKKQFGISLARFTSVVAFYHLPLKNLMQLKSLNTFFFPYKKYLIIFGLKSFYFTANVHKDKNNVVIVARQLKYNLLKMY